MRISETISAAIAASYRVSNDVELEKLRQPVELLLSTCPFFDVHDEPFTSSFDFRSESAHVLTQGPRVQPSKPPKSGDQETSRKLLHVKRIERSGRHDVLVPVHRHECRDAFPIFNEFFRTEEAVSDFAQRVFHHHGAGVADLVEKSIAWTLLAAAEDQRHVCICAPEEVGEEIRSKVLLMNEPMTILVNYHDIHLVRQRAWGEELDYDAKIRVVHGLGEGVILVVANRPHDVGFVRKNSDIEAFCAPAEIGSIVFSTGGEFGFCAWGDAPVWKFDFRDEARRVR